MTTTSNVNLAIETIPGVYQTGLFIQNHDGTGIPIVSYITYASLPDPGATDVLYFAKDTGLIYSWNGSAYVATGNTSSGPVYTNGSGINIAGTVISSDIASGSDITSGTSGKVLDASAVAQSGNSGSTSKVPVIAYVQSLISSAAIGFLNDRGNYDASSNAYPSTGGSGTANAILKGNLWTISVSGTLGGVNVTPGDVLRALVNTPGQTSSNWAIAENNFGYAPENQTNKSDLSTSSTTLYPHTQSVINALAGKANSDSPTFTTKQINSGYIEIAAQAAPATPTAATRLFTDTSNRLAYKGTNGFVRIFDGTANTDDRIYTLPDANTTLVGTDVTQTLTNKSIATTQLTGTLQAAQYPAQTGDVTNTTGSLATTISANAVTYSKIQQVAASSFLGNNTGSAANAIEMTATQATALLNAFTSSLKGLAPASGGGTTNFLRADGIWAAPSSSALSGLTAAISTNSIDSADFTQTWSWDSLSSNNGLTLSSTSTAAASNSQALLNIALSGANSNSTQTTYGAKISNTHTGTSSTNIGLQVSASGGTNNYGLIVQAGSSGFGTTAPGAFVEIVAPTTTGNGLNVTANSLTTGSAVNIASGSVTTGNLVNISSTGTAATSSHRGINISLSGANATSSSTTYGQVINNTKTGTSSTNVGLQVNVSGGTNNYAFVVQAGSSGFGTTTPTSIVDIVASTAAGNGLNVTANSLTTGNAVNIASSSMTSGVLLNLAATGTAATGGYKGIFVNLSGANATSGVTTTGQQISNTRTGTSSTNVCLSLSASGGANNYALIVPNGSSGFGNSTPTATVDITGTLAVSGIATVPTAAYGTNTTQAATTAYVLASERDVINAQTGTGYTLVLSDEFKTIEMLNASGNTLTVPTNASVAFPVGAIIKVVQTGAGLTSIAAAGGVTINARVGLNSLGQWSEIFLTKRATNTWRVSGDLSA